MQALERGLFELLPRLAGRRSSCGSATPARRCLRYAPSRPRAASAEEARFFETTQGNTRKREVTTMRCRRRSRVRALQPIQRSWKRLRRRLGQRASQPAAVPACHEIPDRRPEGTPVAKVVVAVDESVPELPSMSVTSSTRSRRRSASGSLRLRVDGPHVADAVLPLRRQLEDAVVLQRLHHPETGP